MPKSIAAQEIETNLPPYAGQTLREAMAESLRPARISQTVFGLASVIALLLASVGLYGLVSYSLERRKVAVAMLSRAAHATANCLFDIVAPLIAGILTGIHARMSDTKAWPYLLWCVSEMFINDKSVARRVPRIAITLALVSLLTFVFHVVVPVNATTIGFIYLIAVLLVAASWGLTEAVVVSVTATACFNYFFLPPTLTWTIADPENWVAFFTFLLSSLVTSELSNRAKRRAVEATNRRAEIERLYALSRALILMDLKTPTTKQIADEIARIYAIPLVAIYDRWSGEIHGTGPLGDLEESMRQAINGGPRTYVTGGSVTITTFGLSDRLVGAFAIKGATLSETAREALGNLIATNLESARSREIATKADAARQSEEFKSTLLDGLAHEFKTPLTSIKAVTTALLTASVPNAEQQHELLTVADQEADRLSRLVTEAMHLARIEAGKIQLNRQSHSMAQIIHSSLEQTAVLRNGRPMEISMQEDLPMVQVDRELIELTMRQLIDNAVKYSPQESPIRITVTRAGDAVAVAIHNWGEPLSESEQGRIFDKFYRGRNARHQPAGAGIGLAIAREIFSAHGGNIRVESSNDRGTEFMALLPCAAKESTNEFVARARG